MHTITLEVLAERMDDLAYENQRLGREIKRLKLGRVFGGTAMLVGLLAWPHIAGVPRSIRSEAIALLARLPVKSSVGRTTWGSALHLGGGAPAGRYSVGPGDGRQSAAAVRCVYRGPA